MRRQLLFIQGGGEGAHDRWDDKLVASLARALGADWEIRYPRMPDEGDPHYAAWKAAIGREIAGLDAGAVVVGHSIGGTMLIHALAEAPPAVWPAAVVLVAAPYVGAGGWPAGEIAETRGIGARLPAGVPVHVFHGDADDTAPVAHAALWARAVPGAAVHLLAGRGHQLGEDLREVAGVIAGLGVA